MGEVYTSESKLTFAVLISSMDGLYQELIWKGIVKKAGELGINLIFFPGNPILSPVADDAFHNSIYSCLPLEQLSGIIIASGTLTSYVEPAVFESLIAGFGKIPIVSISQKIPKIPSITIDNKSLMVELVNHLIQVHGFKKLAFVKGPDHNDEAQERFQAFCNAMEVNNIKVDPDLIVDGFFDPDSGNRAVKVLLDERHVSFDALMCANDDMAIGAYLEFMERGIRVPEDVVITGFDGIEDIAFKYNNISITTAKQPISEMGEEAVDALVNEINGKLKNRNKELLGKALFRDSCGCLNTSITVESQLEDLKHESQMRLELQRLLLHMRTTITDMTGIEDYETLKREVLSTFPSVGFRSFYMTLFHPPLNYIPGEDYDVSKLSRLAIAYNENGPITQKKEIVFETKRLLPQEVLNYQDSFILLIQPLFSKENQYGLMIHPFNKNEATIYGSIRELLSSALNTITLSSKRKIAEIKLKDTLHKLQYSEENYRKMAYLLPTLLFETDLEFNFSFMNKVILELLSLEQDKYKNNSLLSYINSDDRVRLTEYCQKLITTGTTSFIKITLCLENIDKTVILAKASPLLNEKRIEGYRWSAINIKPMINSMINPDDSFFKQFNLTPREVEVLTLLLEGNKNRRVSEKLFIAESTVKDHLGSIYNKMNVKNRQELFTYLEESQNLKFSPESLLFSVISKLISD